MQNLSFADTQTDEVYFLCPSWNVDGSHREGGWGH